MLLYYRLELFIGGKVTRIGLIEGLLSFCDLPGFKFNVASNRIAA